MSLKRPLAVIEKELARCRKRMARLEQELDDHPDMLKRKLGAPELVALVDSGRLTEYITDIDTNVNWKDSKATAEVDMWHASVVLDGERINTYATRVDGSAWSDIDTSSETPTIWVPKEPEAALGKPYEWARIWSCFLERNDQHLGRALASLQAWLLVEHNNSDPSILFVK